MTQINAKYEHCETITKTNNLSVIRYSTKLSARYDGLFCDLPGGLFGARPALQSDVQVNFAATELVRGPFGLDAAVFLADVLIKYHQQLRLEHSIRYVTSDCAKTLGRRFDNAMNWEEADRKQYWKQVSFLAGWEIIRRATEDQALLERSQQGEVDLVDVFEAGQRLVYNRNIDNINFMIVVALAEIF